MLTPGTFISKLTAVAILMLLLACIGLFAVLPLTHALRSQDKRLSELAALISRFDGEVRALSVNQDTQAKSTRQAPILMEAPTELTATGNLQKNVKAKFEASQIALMRLSFLPAREINDMRVLSLSFQARGELAALQKALHGLETGEPPVFVDAIFLRRETTPTQEADNEKTNRTLIADISLSSLWMPEQTP